MQLLGIPPSRRIPDEQPSCAIRGPALQRARERIGFDIDHWHQLNWYLNLSNLKIETLSDGDLLNLQEEVIALCRLLTEYTNAPLLTQDQLRALQREIRKPFEDLVNTGTALLGPFSYKACITCPASIFGKNSSATKVKSSLRRQSLPPLVALKFLVDDSTDKSNERYIPNILLSHLADLLSLMGNSIVRCPKCQKMFLQFRRHAKFCSRECQSRAAMASIREKKKIEKSKPTPSVKKHQTTASKRRK